jgi:hypothetical protein
VLLVTGYTLLFLGHFTAFGDLMPIGAVGFEYGACCDFVIGFKRSMKVFILF